MTIITVPLIFSPVVNAVESNATITFSAPVEDAPAPEILNPADPNELNPDPPNDEDGIVTGETGPLTLDFVTHLNFGSSDIEAGTQTIKAVNPEPFIQVTDRRGTGEGWDVTASVTNFQSEGTDTLNGSVITLNNGQAVSNSNSDAPVVGEVITLTTGSTAPQPVVSASSGESQGLGSWIVRWFDPEGSVDRNATLTIPAGSATTGDHMSTITWTLSSGV